MKMQIIAALVTSCAMTAMAEPAKNPPALAPVEAAIPATVAALGEPAVRDFPNGLQMAVSASSEKVQAHVNQGMNHLHGGWEIEASRHFAAAMREDPECLLAHWGMVMSLLTPSPETLDARNAATERLLDLMERGNGSALERGYVYGLIKYLEEGPAGAANAFRKIAKEFPNDLQAEIFAALFSRSGYDDQGSARPDQEAAELSLLALIEKHPASPLPLNALLTIRAEAHKLGASVVLARKLCQMAPDYAPYAHLLGHYEWRTGQHGAAAAAFTRASSLYQAWMSANKASVADCPEWVKAECYRVVSLTSKGEFDTAYAAARKLTATPVPKKRAASPGARLLLWEAQTLPARILLHRGNKGNAVEAMNTLIKPEIVKNTRRDSLAHWWINGVRLSLEAQRLIDLGKLDQARDVMTAITQHGEAMAQAQAAALANGERSAWTRAFRAFEVLASSLRGSIVLAGPKDKIGTAYNWFAGAADRQQPAPMMYPPMILTPMASRLGDYHLAAKQPADAIEAYQRALAAFPNDMNALTGLKQAYLQAKLPQDAALTAKKIAELRAQ